MRGLVAVRNLRVTLVLRLCLMWLALAHWQSFAAAQAHEHPAPEKLGVVRFPTSCSASAQKEFQRAVALLHSFA